MNDGYIFYLVGALNREVLAAALTDLTESEVDIGDDGQDDRNWAAPVSCTVTPLIGDLSWHLDIYFTDAVVKTPPTTVAVAFLAARLKTVVAYKEIPLPPSAFWLVDPHGARTRARIYEEDDGYQIDAVERPIAALPLAPVAVIEPWLRS
ncbi:hypothetical protein [Paractinoplanes brasiliensis]|uniref:Uncharacterized protein n=1 Tax=Paractinoplanes brasiliensis TaxID=52695 RepID=A0A4R6JSU3_9ACTN|nr:hypothetical protein [Actinoplanes brasiliensis]TDO39684.1 hypothetical protein C8E87_3380 [Actinoplanes brasiliensis]